MKALLFPLIWLLRNVYLGIVALCGSYGFSLLILSVLNSALMLWLGSLISLFPKREALVQSLMAPRLAEIKKEPDAALRHAQTTALYRKYAYHPVLALRSAVPLLLQLPFLFAAYHALSNLGALQGESFAVFQDLSKPDALLYGINLLPILMSLVNIVTAVITPSFSLKDKLQAVVIAGLFFVLLYNAAAALLIFWTMNNVIYLAKAMVERRKRGAGVVHARGGLAEHLEPVLDFLGQYFVLLSLFYLYQALALESGFVFESFLKYVPLFIAAAGLFVLQLLKLKRARRLSLYHLLIAETMLILVAISVVFYSIITQGAFNLALLFNILSYTMIFTAFILSFFVPNSRHEDRWIANVPVCTKRARHEDVSNPPTSQQETPSTPPSSHHTETETLSLPGRLLSLLILSLIPAVHYAKMNSDYLMGTFRYIYFLSIPLIALLSYLASLQISRSNQSKSRIAIASALFTLLFIALPLIRFSLRLTSNVDLDFWLLLFLALLLSYFINSKKRAQRFLQLSGFVLLVFIASGFFWEKPLSGTWYPRKKLSPEMSEIAFIEKPNIYLFVYDGIPNERVFREQGLSFEGLKSLLDRHGFKLYDDTYSLGNCSLTSMGKMLDFTDRAIKPREGRDIYAGNSWANLVLRDQGYQSKFILDNYLVGFNAITHSELFDEIYPSRTGAAARGDYFVVLMRGILQGEMRFDTEGLFAMDEKQIQARKHEIIREKKSGAFVVNHYSLPGHSQNSGKCLPNETELWIEKFEEALGLIERDFELIEKYDPEAIVITLGDHGPSLLGDCYLLADWEREEITPQLMWDRLGTLLALRWGDAERAAKYDGAIVTNQDVFPVLFAYLTDDEGWLEYCPGKLFWGSEFGRRGMIGFEKGEIVLEK
ncbi:MAG: YidC/Oxa1 family membrane protein insertase [Candidatus Cloacimonetes bacterium]|nr:YidC/Oxa1 family membrane protein insertase [Candidatus Cloacimonadota bacterium]